MNNKTLNSSHKSLANIKTAIVNNTFQVYQEYKITLLSQMESLKNYNEHMSNRVILGPHKEM